MKRIVKKSTKRNIILAAAAAAIVAAAVCFFGVSSTENFYGGESPLWESGPAAVLSIECKTAAEHRELLPKELRSERYVPADGYILAPVKLSLTEGESVCSLLVRAAKYYKIPFDIQGIGENTFSAAYIRGINQLYEFSAGELSGWMYCVNGEFPSVGCGEYPLKDGDEVRIVYTLELGRDIGGGVSQ